MSLISSERAAGAPYLADPHVEQHVKNHSPAFSQPNAVAHAAISSMAGGELVGYRKGESVELSLRAASDITSLRNAEEVGAFLAGRIPLGRLIQNSARRPVGGKADASGGDSISSVTSDVTEEQADYVRRLLVFRAFTRDAEDGDRGSGQEQLRYYERVKSQTTKKIKKSTDELLKRFSAIRDDINGIGIFNGRENLELSASQRRDITAQLWSALRGYDSDAVQQLAALEIASRYFKSGAPADDVLLSICASMRQEFDEITIQRAVLNVFSIIRQADLARATRESNLALFRDKNRAILTESDNFSHIFNALQAFDISRSFPKIVDEFLSKAGSDLANFIGPKRDTGWQHVLLTELSVLKKLNSVFDYVQQMIIDPMKKVIARLEEMKNFDAALVTKSILSFISTESADRTSISVIEGVMPKEATLEDLVLYSTCISNLHKALPDDLFPGGEVNGEQALRNAQEVVLKLWREEIALQEEAEAA